jgi:hypothetical protein
MNQQTADVGSESGNVIIQIVGNGNTVVPGHGWLQLTRHTKSLKPGSKLQQLISVSRRNCCRRWKMIRSLLTN